MAKVTPNYKQVLEGYTIYGLDKEEMNLILVGLERFRIEMDVVAKSENEAMVLTHSTANLHHVNEYDMKSSRISRLINVLRSGMDDPCKPTTT